MKRSCNRGLLVGCVADDFTGASDIASFFSIGGLDVLLTNGIPGNGYEPRDDIECIVVALKSRNDEPSRAVKGTLDAFNWLRSIGCKQMYFKYCSTFDSAPEGNIGPVIDSLLETYGIRYTVISPALPVNGRTVVDGCIYVNGVPLDKSPMKDHPITPMWSSSISELMAGQGKYKVYEFTRKMFRKSKDDINMFIDSIERVSGSHFYFALDYYKEAHAKKLIDIFGNLPLITGSSGLAFELAKSYIKITDNQRKRFDKGSNGRGIILSGSCSVVTGGQIKDYLEKGGHFIEVNPEKLLRGEQTLEGLLKQIIENTSKDILIHSYDQNVGKQSSFIPQKHKSKILEETMSAIGKQVISNGFTRIVVAGGETSGAVTKALGYNSFFIGEAVSPGVPVLIPEKDTRIRLVLKSGNFGVKGFFSKAMDLI